MRGCTPLIAQRDTVGDTLGTRAIAWRAARARRGDDLDGPDAQSGPSRPRIGRQRVKVNPRGHGPRIAEGPWGRRARFCLADGGCLHDPCPDRRFGTEFGGRWSGRLARGASIPSAGVHRGGAAATAAAWRLRVGCVLGANRRRDPCQDRLDRGEHEHDHAGNHDSIIRYCRCPGS